jgi:outer membrane protein
MRSSISTTGSETCHTTCCACLGALIVLLLLAPLNANAQPRQPAPKPQPPRPPGMTDMPLAPHVEEPVVPIVANGLTAEQAAKRAVSSSPSAKSAEETAAAAGARTEQAQLDYIPTLLLTAKYTRFSAVTPPSGTSSGLATTAAPGTVNPPIVATAPSTFPVVLDNFLMAANVTVPVSDYFLKINRTLTAATQSEEAARFDVIAARATASVNAKQAYYDWLRSRGAFGVAEQTLAAAQAHANDAKLQFTAGAVAGADVLRAESVVAASELVVERAKAKVTSSEWTLRTLMHATDQEKLEPGESLESALPGVGDNLKAMLTEAYTTRAEMKSIEKNVEAARKLAAVARADRIPSLSGFGELLYANPNARKFPTTAEFFPSWSVGAQLTWSPKRFLVAGPAGAEQEFKASSLEAQRDATRDGIVKEVVDAYTTVGAADAGLGTTTRQLDSAREAYRVSRQLYAVGRTTGTALLDAEFALAQARFDHLNARVDARVARVQLEHAVGRDVVTSRE